MILRGHYLDPLERQPERARRLMARGQRFKADGKRYKAYCRRLKGLPIERFLNQVCVRDNGCWQWLGAWRSFGYGGISIGVSEKGHPRNVLAHRFSYEYFVGPIKSGLEIDHQCGNRRCVNPDHLEVVTRTENRRRGADPQRAKTHCRNGHAYDATNTYLTPAGNRSCRTCHRRAIERYRAKEARYERAG